MPSTFWSGRPRGPYPWNQRTNKQKDEDLLLAKFETEAERAEAARERYFKAIFVREKFFRLTQRRKAYDDYHRRLHAKRLKDEYAQAVHQALRTSWQFMADTDKLTYQYPVEKAAARLSIKNREEWLETQKELDKWDFKHEVVEESETPRTRGKGAKFAKDKKAPPGPVPKPTDLKAAKGGKVDKKSPKTPEADVQQLPDPLLWRKEAIAYMESVKVKRAKELQDNFEAQQLERKERLQKEEAERALQQAVEDKALEDLKWELEYGKEALRIKEEQRKVDEEERKKFEYRHQMATYLNQERQAEWDDVTNRDRELLSMMREDCLTEVYQERLLWEATRQRKMEETKARRVRFCKETMLQMVTMMDIRIDYRAEFGSEISASNWRGWKILFIQGAILPCPSFGDIVMSTEPLAPDPNDVFAKAAVVDYLEEKREWQQGANTIGKNEELGVILSGIHGVADSPPEPPPLPDLKKFKLKIAVVGTPFAGKTTVARKLESDFECVRIDMQKLVGSAIELAETEEKIQKAKIAEEERKWEEDKAKKILEEKQKMEFNLQQEALGLKNIYLRPKSGIQGESLLTSTESPELAPALPTKSNEGNEPSIDTKKKKKQDSKAGTKVGAEAEKSTSKSRNLKNVETGEKKEKTDKGKKTGKEKPVESPPEPPLAPVTEPEPFGPPPNPPHPLDYLTPKARYGMEVKMAQLEGLEAPQDALAGLVLLTISNLREYADVFGVESELPQKGTQKKGKGGVPSKKGEQSAGKKGAPPSPRAKSPSSPLQGKAETKTGPKAANSPRGKKGATAEPEAEKAMGFILDGFPNTVREAKALEWRLSGIDLDYVLSHHARASKIAPPPKLVLSFVSRLDGYFLLQGLDENECFKRAMGKVIDEKTGRIYHVDYDPPPPVKANPKEKGLIQRLKPVEELEVVRPKIVKGLEMWPPLCQYLGIFANVFPIVQQENEGKAMVDTVAPCDLADKFLDRWSKTQAVKVAAQAGFEAQNVASNAQIAAENASKLASEVAQKLWCVKLAEVETEQGLDALGGDELAKQLIKDKASVIVTKRLDEACKAAKEAREAAETAENASLQAEQRANLAQDNLDEVDFAFAVHLKAEAEEAAEVAKQASSRADKAHKKAVLAFEAAAAALLPRADASEDKKNDGKTSKGDAKDAKGSKVAKEGKSGKASKDTKPPKDAKGASGTKDAKDAKDAKVVKGATGGKGSKGESPMASPSTGPESQLATGPTSPRSPLEHKQPFLQKELAVALHTEWEGTEANYLKQLESVFYVLHQEKAMTRNHVVEIMDRFVTCLQSRDERQTTFDDFQDKWNRIETRQRLDRKFKPKLQAEVVKLESKLQEICARREKNCLEFSEKSLVELLESRTASLTGVFTALLQTELDRHLQSCSILKEFFSQSLGSEVLRLRCNLEDSTNELHDKFPVPAWTVALAAPLPKLHMVFMKALSVSYAVLDVIAGKEPEKTGGKGKVGREKKEEKSKKLESDKKSKKGSNQSLDGPTIAASTTETSPVPLDPTIPLAIGREHEILLRRLQKVAKVALDYRDELHPIGDGAFQLMKKWSIPRLKAEADVVREVIDLCAEAANEQIPLWYRVYMDGDIFRVDKSQPVLECPLKEKTNLNLWNCKVLENLLTDCKAVSPQANYMTAGLAMATIKGAIMKTHAMFKEDLKESILPRMPASKRSPYGPFQSWGELADRVFEEIIKDTTKEEKFVEWRVLLLALVDAQFSNIISSTSCEDILNARKALLPIATLDKEGVLKGPDAHGYISIEDLLSVKFWFDSAVPPAPGQHDLGLALKIFLFNLLDEPTKGVHYQKLLLYLCRDKNKEQLFRRSTEHQLTPETILSILHPGGIEAAWNEAIVPFILEDLYNLLYYVAKEKWDKAEREKESDLQSSEESGSNDDTNPWLQTLAAERIERGSSATESDRATVEDFLSFAYQEFPELSQAETIKDFLCYLNIQKDPYGGLSDCEKLPYKCDVHVTVPTTQEAEAEEPDPYAIPDTYTVASILNTSATTNLSNVLYGNFGTNVLHLFDRVTIEDDTPQEAPPEEEEKQKKKKKAKDNEKKEKKEKKETKK